MFKKVDQNLKHIELISHIIGFLGFVVPFFSGTDSVHGLLLSRRSVLTYLFKCHLALLIRRHCATFFNFANNKQIREERSVGMIKDICITQPDDTVGSWNLNQSN